MTELKQPLETEREDDDIVNNSGNRTFGDVLNVAVSRRGIMKGGLASAGAFMAGSSFASGATRKRFIGFEALPKSLASGPEPSISADYEFSTLIPWGDPIEPGGPAYSYPPTAADQARQVGIGHDGMWFFPRRIDGEPSNTRGLLAINHEFGTNSTVFGRGEPGSGNGDAQPESLSDVRTSQHAHGMSVIEIAKRGRRWVPIKSKEARRIHVNTPVTFSGPVADSDLLKTRNGNVPLGTVNNCSSGYTPWNTYLTCEENFNGYFGATNATSTWEASEAQARYGFSSTGFGYGWEKFDRRFDLSDEDYANEENRFGWVVAVDPFDATQTPVKRTALGRIKHEGIAITVGKDGRIVGYMGDDQRFDYIYKFVSADNWRKMRAEGKSPLDEGKLYVARFDDDRTGEWLELTIDNPILAAKFTDQAEVLTYARLAADELGATPMDRPEWTTVAPDGQVYCTLTNNSRREDPNAANPLAPNPDGHIIRWRDSEEFTGTTFEWDIFLVAATTHGTEDTFSDPDGLWADPAGRLFIQTDGGQQEGLNNQMLVMNPLTRELKRLFAGVTSDEITGIAVTPDRRTMFINMQHPGNGDPRRTNFPAPTDGVTIPRDVTLVITRKNGGIIGS